MAHYICTTCGVQFAETNQPPEYCLICEDERQYIGWDGQQWTTLETVRERYHNIIKSLETDLTGIRTEPKFGIGQQALLVQAPGGNVLWDCITLLDDVTIAAIQALGGISAIAISHPHYYSAIVEWGHAFDVSVYIHANDRRWVMRPDPSIVFWEGETKPVGQGLTLIRCGGHYPGGTVLHWATGAEGRGILLSGDILQVVQDRRYVSFMYSYPNLIPLPATAVHQIVAAIEPFPFERIYGAFSNLVVKSDAKAGVVYSAERYINALEGVLPEID